VTGSTGTQGADHAHRVGVIRGLVTSFIAALKTRLDLATVEAEIFLLRVLSLLLWALAALACALLAVVFGVVTIIAALWDTHRIAGLLGGTGFFVVLALVFALVASRSMRGRPGLLEGTLTQLETDQHRMSGTHE
jgi:uncharacterized membrane protein YqjE